MPADSMLQESQGLVQDLLSARESLLQRGVKPGTIALQCGLASLTFGFLFQITHNVGFLPVGTAYAAVWPATASATALCRRRICNSIMYESGCLHCKLLLSDVHRCSSSAWLL